MEAGALSPRTELNAQQLALVELIADPTDHRNYADKFQAAGYSEAHGYQLTRDAKFIEAVRSRTRELVGGELPKVYRELVKDATGERGLPAEDRHRAAGMLLKATGEIQPGGVTINDNRITLIVGELPDALKAHDAERRAIMREVMSVDHAQVADEKAPRRGKKHNGNGHGNGNGGA